MTIDSIKEIEELVERAKVREWYADEPTLVEFLTPDLDDKELTPFCEENNLVYEDFHSLIYNHSDIGVAVVHGSDILSVVCKFPQDAVKAFELADLLHYLPTPTHRISNIDIFIDKGGPFAVFADIERI